MAITVKHTKVSTIPDGDDTSVVRPSDWNADHQLVGTVPVDNGGTGASTLTGYVKGNGTAAMTASATVPSTDITGLGTMSTQNANNVAVTGGTVSGTTLTSDTVSNNLAFTPTTAPTYVEGDLWYDSTQKALAYYNDVTNNQVHIGQEVQLKVINNTGSSIANGTPVYVTGTSSGQSYPNIALAQANSSSTSAVLGLTNGTIASGATGYVCTAGLLTPCNTGSFSVGQVLYLSPYSAGQMMNTVPPTGYAVQIGVVAYANTPNGSIYVKQTTPLAVSASTIVGQVAVANGGTGAATLTGYVKGSGTSAMTASSTIPTTDLSGTITNAQLANSAITINGTSTSLGGSISVGTVTSVAATAGTGISVSGSPITGSGTLNITNTAPDQTVVLTAGTGISTSGTYPNFTITNTSPSSGGTVTSVTGTAPVVSSGGNTPAISMAAANTTTNGYLTSTDWNTFNGKQPAGTYVNFVSGTTGRITSTGGTTPVIDLASGVATAGTTGSSTLIPVITIDTYGRVTSITTASNPQGTVTSVSGTGTVSGISLSGTVTSSGSLTLGGTLDLSSPPAIGGTAANTITGTTITATKFVGVSGGTF
jgi:hypothetical protein